MYAPKIGIKVKVNAEIIPLFMPGINTFIIACGLVAPKSLAASRSEKSNLSMAVKIGIISALTFTFIPIFGAYTVPLLVGGKDSYMLGNVIVDQVQKTRNWPLAAAFSMVITIISIVGILWISFANNKDSKLKKSVAKEEVYLSSLNTKGIKK